MKRLTNCLKAGLLVVAIGLLVTGCANKKKGESSTREIWENRTERNLDRVLTEANLSMNEAMERLQAISGQDGVDSVRVREAEEDVEKARHTARAIISYMRILQTPSEERTEEESKTLKNVYEGCRKIENDGWGYQVSKRLVKYVESVKSEAADTAE